MKRRIEEVERREARLKRDYEQKEAAKIRELEQRNEKLIAEFETNARSTIDNIMQTAESRKAAEQSLRKVSKARREFRESFAGAVQEAAPKAMPAGPKLEEGARVRLKGVRSPARVRRILDGEHIEVEAGFMKMQVSRDDIEEVLPPDGQGSKLPQNVSFRPAGPRWDVSYSEINLIGKRAEEAMDELDKFLDHAATGRGHASADRARPRDEYPQEGGLGLPQEEPARGKVLPRDRSGGWYRRDHCGVERVVTCGPVLFPACIMAVSRPNLA